MTASARLDLQARASVVVDFELSWLVADDDDVSEVLAFLEEDCERVHTPHGARWSITDQRRTETLRSVPVLRLRDLRKRVVEADPTPIQKALDRSLGHGWTSTALDRLPAHDARPLSVVAGWWAGARRSVPTPEDLYPLVSKLTLFADVRAMADDHFVGRRAVLTDLRDHFHQRGAPPYLLHGLGGVGKSAVLAKHLVWALDEAGALAAVLDFDDPTLNPNYGAAELVNRIVDVVARQIGNAAERLRQIARDVADTSGYRTLSNSKATSFDTREWTRLIPGILSETTAPILVVLDTFEQVQRRGPSAVSEMLTLVSVLNESPQIRVVIAGRADVDGLTARRTALNGLEPHEAARLLTALTAQPLQPETATRIVSQFGGSPLTIRLAAQLLSATGEPGDLFALDLHAEQIDAELYRRVLAHISDPDVAKLAHPGLILRRITPGIIQYVLAGPCKVPVHDEWEAQNLFDRFADEPMLVEMTKDRTTLVHRTDVREIMLPLLLRDRPDAARRIQRAAIKYYASAGEAAGKVEELYHRLMLQQSPATLAKHWDDRAAETLVTAIDELPRGSRAYLTSRLPDTFLRDEDRRLLSDQQWVAQVEPQVQRLITTRALTHALDLLGERRGRDGQPLLPGLEIEVLEALERYGEAIALARDSRQSAAIGGNSADVVTFSLHLARLLERSNATSDAIAVLDEALAALGERSTDRLRLLTAWLGLQRRIGAARARDQKRHTREAISIYRRHGPAKVRKVPGLLRDLAAEVGNDEPEILTEALRTVGIDVFPTGSVPSALAELQERHTEATEPDHIPVYPTKMVAEDEIIAMPRGETGHALSEVIAANVESAENLTKAVTEDYQFESDAALFSRW